MIEECYCSTKSILGDIMMKNYLFLVVSVFTLLFSSSLLASSHDDGTGNYRFMDGLKLFPNQKDCVVREITNQIAPKFGSVLIITGAYYIGEHDNRAENKSVVEIEIITDRPDPNTGLAGTVYKLGISTGDGSDWTITEASNGRFIEGDTMDFNVHAIFKSDLLDAFDVDIAACHDDFYAE
jgi:hypothetical protein